MNKIEYMKKQYDVVIIGAGPGGLRCAQILGDAGKNVLLIEKNDVVGPKICAGGLTRKTIIYLRNLGLPEDLIEQRFDGIVFRTKKWRTYIDFGKAFVYTIDRANLGQWQLQELAKMESVTVQTGTHVEQVTKKCIVLSTGEKITYDFLVGADGAHSIVRKFLGIKTKLYGVAFQHIIQAKKYKEIEIILDSTLFHSWYAWIFPHRDCVSIGTGYFPRIVSGAKARKKFDQWLLREKIDVGTTKFEAHPINCDYRGFHFDNIFLVGDAAGLASGFTGEGIYQALVSGDEVAHTILDENHKSKAVRALLWEKRTQEFLLAMLVFLGPFRVIALYLTVLLVKIPFLGKSLLRTLS